MRRHRHFEHFRERDAVSPHVDTLRDPLARELAGGEQRAPPVIRQRERDALDIATGGLPIGEPVYHALVQAPLVAPEVRFRDPELLPQALDYAQSRPPQSDRRAYHPAGAKRPPVDVHGLPADYVVAPARNEKASQAFKRPDAYLPCIARKTRREVMFAKRKAGKGYKVRKRRNWLSDIPC